MKDLIPPAQLRDVHRMDDFSITRLATLNTHIKTYTKKNDAIALFIQNDTIRLNTGLVINSTLKEEINHGFKVFESRNFPSTRQTAYLLDKNFLVIQRFATVKGFLDDLKSIQNSISNKNKLPNLVPYFYSDSSISEHTIRSLLVKLSFMGVRTAVFDNTATSTEDSIELILTALKDLLEFDQESSKNYLMKKNAIENSLTNGSDMLAQAKRESDGSKQLLFYQEAEKYFTKAIKMMDDKEVEGFLLRGDTFFYQHQYSKAMNDYRYAVQRRNNSVEILAKNGLTLFHLSKSYMKEGNLATSKELYAKGKEMICRAEDKASLPWNDNDPGALNSSLYNPVASVLLAILEVEEIDFSIINENIKSDLTELKHRTSNNLPSPEDPSFSDIASLLTLAEANICIKKFKEAEIILKKIYPLDPYLVVPLYNNLASSYRKERLFHAALMSYFEIIKYQDKLKEEANTVTINCYVALNCYDQHISEICDSSKTLSVDTIHQLSDVLVAITKTEMIPFEEAAVKFQGVNKETLPSLSFINILTKDVFLSKYIPFALKTIPLLICGGEKNTTNESSIIHALTLITLILDNTKVTFLSEHEQKQAQLKKSIILNLISKRPSIEKKLGLINAKADALSSLTHFCVLNPNLSLFEVVSKEEVIQLQGLISNLIQDCSSVMRLSFSHV